MDIPTRSIFVGHSFALQRVRERYYFMPTSGATTKKKRSMSQAKQPQQVREHEQQDQEQEQQDQALQQRATTTNNDDTDNRLQTGSMMRLTGGDEVRVRNLYAQRGRSIAQAA
ncbi:MAG: hypothetical protein IPK82_23115 [Polyangiaceae bacterium]|nr:hypothetical protein [Polyangiaceae bacterium]